MLNADRREQLRTWLEQCRQAVVELELAPRLPLETKAKLAAGAFLRLHGKTMPALFSREPSPHTDDVRILRLLEEVLSRFGALLSSYEDEIEPCLPPHWIKRLSPHTEALRETILMWLASDPGELRSAVESYRLLYREIYALVVRDDGDVAPETPAEQNMDELFPWEGPAFSSSLKRLAWSSRRPPYSIRQR